MLTSNNRDVFKSKTPDKRENSNIPVEIFNEIHRKMYGIRTEELTPSEINELFKLPVTAEFNLALFRALQLKAIDPDVAILQIIPLAKTKDYLIPIALCLRFGADANMYVKAPKLGIIHILGYIYIKLGDSDDLIMNTIILMLLVKGSRPVMNMYDSNAGKILQDRDNNKEQSVTEWLNANGIPTILNSISMGDSGSLRKVLDPDSQTLLSILLDKPEIMGREYLESDTTLAIKSRSINVFDKLPDVRNKVFLDDRRVFDAVQYLNYDVFDRLVNRGILPSYILTTSIISQMKKYNNPDHTVAYYELQRMFLSAIDHGLQLDQEQMTLIMSLGEDFVTNVRTKYEIPYWKKACLNSVNGGSIDGRLRDLGISLNLQTETSRGGICEQISKISMADKNTLIEAARKRQQARLDANTAVATEFIESTPAAVCRNRGVLPENPLDYNDIDIASYRDDQGAVWCFTSDMYQNLLDKKINPYNNVILPTAFLEKVRYQQKILKNLGLKATTGPTSYPTALNQLETPDKVSNSMSDSMLQWLQIAAAQTGINTGQLVKLEQEDIGNALASIGYQVQLDDISRTHALITAAYILQEVSKEERERFFVSLGILSQTSKF